jgi:predicted permease
LLDGVARLPGVRAAGSINRLPMTGNASSGTFMIDNNAARTGYAEYRLVSAGYFEAMDIPLLKGRAFADIDRSNAPQVALISESLAKRVWPNEDPVGQRIQFGNMDGDMRLMSVVGVVGDVRDRSPDRSPRPTVYANALQRPGSTSLAVVARTDVDPAMLFAEMRRTVRSLNPELPMKLRSLDQIFASTLDQRRFSLVVFGIFASVALMLAVTGIYGVMAYSVAQRTQEIGIRMAMGATVRNMLGLVMRQGLKLIAPGVVIGLAGAFFVTRLVASLLFEVNPADAGIFGVIAVLISGAALLACYIPARRASRVDPMVALRRE